MKSIWSIVSFKTCVSLLIFCSDDLSIGVSEVLNSPTINVLLSISSFFFSSKTWEMLIMCKVSFEVFFCFFFKIFICLFIYLFIAVLGLHFCARAFSSCGKQGPLLIAVCGPLTITDSLVAEHRLQRRKLTNCGSQAQPLHGMWDPPRPGLEPVSPALAGRFSTIVPPGKPDFLFYSC